MYITSVLGVDVVGVPVTVVVTVVVLVVDVVGVPVVVVVAVFAVVVWLWWS